MKRLLRQITICYIVPIIAMSGFYFYCTMQHIVPSKEALQNAYATSIAEYMWVSHTGPAKGFLLGSSTIRYGVSCSLLHSDDSLWYNFAMDARDPIVSYLVLEKYWPLKQPKTVIVGLDPWIYAKAYYAYRKPIMYLDLDGWSAWKYRREDRNIIFSKAKEYLKYKLGIPGVCHVPGDTVVPADYGSATLTRKAANFNWMRGNIFSIEEYGWSGIQFYYLEQIKRYCDERGVKAIFVIPPKRADFIEWTTKGFPVEQRQWWDSVNKHIGGAFLINAISAFSLLNQDSIFADSYHLNPRGQTAFSLYLKQRITMADTILPSVKPF